MTWANFCCTFQAVVWVTPSRRASSRLEIPFFDWVIRYIAWNQMVSGKLVEWKMVPAVSDAWCRQRRHWYSFRPLISLQRSAPQRRQTNAFGQRQANSAARHWSSLP